MRLSVPEVSRTVSAPPETRTRTVERKQRKESGGRKVTQSEGAPRTESESEEDDLWYCYPDRIERQPRPESDAQDGSAVEKNTVYRGGELDRPHAEVAEPTFTAEGHAELPDQSPEEMGDPGLEGGDPGADNTAREVVEPVHSHPKRNRRPVVRLSYDSLGRPTNRPLTLVHRGMVINVEGGKSEKKPCSTVWCHTMAQCTRCAQVSAQMEPRVTVKV